PKVQKTRKRLTQVNREFAVPQKNVESVVLGSTPDKPIIEKPKDFSQTKKEREKARHEKWIQSQWLLLLRMDIEETLTFNIASLKESLSTVDISENPESRPRGAGKSNSQSPSSAKTKAARKNIAMSEIQRFHKVLQHSAFKDDPLLTIKQHVENTIERKKDMANGKTPMNVE
ncbi:9322_t:CDS:2, partial [Acaulospora morrowiae]